MIKRTIIFTLLFSFLFSSLNSASLNAKFGIGLKGAYTIVNPADFNDDFSNVVYYGFKNTAPDPSKLKTAIGSNIEAMGQGSLDIKYFIIDNLAILLRSDYLITEYDDILNVDNKDVLDSYVQLNILYLGLGARYYLGFEGIKLYPYLSLDGGILMNLSTYWEVSAKTNALFTVTDQTKYQSVDFTDMGFGGNAELGLEFLFTDTIGIGAGAGYRYANMPFTYPATGIFKNKDSKGNPIFNATSLDLSGIYFGGGITLYFGGKEPVKAKPAQQIKTGTPQQYEKYGDYYFAKKNYTYALRYYVAAEKQSPNAVLYKKIGFTYYYLNNKPKAIEYIDKYLEQNPNDTKTKNMMKV